MTRDKSGTICAEFLAQALCRPSLVTDHSPPISEFSQLCVVIRLSSRPKPCYHYPFLYNDANVTIGGQTHSAGRKTPHAHADVRSQPPRGRRTSPVAQALLFTQRYEGPVRLRQAHHSTGGTPRDLETSSISNRKSGIKYPLNS